MGEDALSGGSIGVTVDELAEPTCIDPGDITVLVAPYPPEVTGLWEEQGVLAKVINDDRDDVLNPMCARTRAR